MTTTLPPIELLPCPFCGEQPKAYKEGTQMPYMTSLVRCKCGAEIGKHGHGAAEVWNTRTRPDAAQETPEGPINATTMPPPGMRFMTSSTAHPEPLPEQPDEATEIYNRIVEAEAHLSKLCETGGRTWSLSIPVQQYDSDMVYGDMIRYAKQLVALLRSPMRESGALLENDAVLIVQRAMQQGYEAARRETNGFLIPNNRAMAQKAIDALVKNGALRLTHVEGGHS